MKEIIEDFIQKNGNEGLKVSPEYLIDTVASNYAVKDAFNELIDNAIDAKRLAKSLVNVTVAFYDDKMFFKDDGDGISNIENLYTLGGTDKKQMNNKNGKYGIGYKGAASTFAKYCRRDETQPMIITTITGHDGKLSTKKCMFDDSRIYVGKTEIGTCDKTMHFTEHIFENFDIKKYPNEVIESIDETFETPLHDPNGLNVVFENRVLGRSDSRTFIGDEIPKKINVGNLEVEVIHRYIGGKESASDSDREFEKSGIRICDKTTGRLLAASTNYWKWFANKQAQPNICGLRIQINIPSTIESYQKFGVNTSKNGIIYRYYFKDSDFKDLANYLSSIYTMFSKTTVKEENAPIKIGRVNYVFSPGKVDGIYREVDKNNVIVQKKISKEEMIKLVEENIRLKKQINKRKEAA